MAETGVTQLPSDLEGYFSGGFYNELGRQLAMAQADYANGHTSATSRAVRFDELINTIDTIMSTLVD